MAKRRAAQYSDASDVESDHRSSTPAKRARVDDGDENATQPTKSAKGKSKMKQVVQDNEEDDDDEDELDARLSANISRIAPEQDDEQFEAENTAAILDAINKREGRKGVIANMGIIETVEMHQFMCHPRLSFKFGPQINFIIGHNGSGKSAVLSALTIALGGKANSTGRGNGLKSFIREGQSTSEVTISIKNQGDEAFKPETYGKSIFVTRRFTKEGSSSYKIKSTDGKLVSSKRDELSAICDHMNIQVDNPMNILTQDSARQFLSASHPTDKYQFFLKGTQLTQLSEEYETCLENIGKTTCTLQLKRDEIPDLEKAFKEADARNDEANKAREKESELAEYRRELAWAYVKVKETEMTEKIEEAARAGRRIPRVEEAIAKAETDISTAGQKVEDLEAEREALPGVDDIKTDLDRLKEEINRNKEEIRECRNNERDVNRQLTTLSTQITLYESEITKETAKLQIDTQGQREEVQKRLQDAEDERKAANEELEQIEPEKATVQQQVERDRVQGKQCETTVINARQDMEAAESNIQQCQRRDGDNLSLFGRNLPTVLSKIKNESWVGEVPVGPFGSFVALKDPKWAVVMRTQLGQAMSSFAVTDNRDRQKLKQILQTNGNPQVQIVVSDVDLFDYSRGEPPEGVLTVLRAIEIKNEFVKRILINQSHIEKVVLADTRANGDDLLMRLGGNGVAWTADGFIARRYAEGGGTSSPMSKMSNQDSRQHMFTSTDRSADIERWQSVWTEAEKRQVEARETGSECLRRYREGNNKVQTLIARAKTLSSRAATLEAQIVRLKDEVIVEAPVEIGTLEKAKQAAMDEKSSILEQCKNIVDRRFALDSANKPLVEKRTDLESQMSDWKGRDTDMKNKITAAGTERMTASTNKTHWENKLAEEKAAVAELESVVDIVQTEFQEWSEKAERVGAQFEKPRKPLAVERSIDSVTRALQQHERRQGATPDEIAVERANAKQALDNHMRQLDEVSKLNKALKASLALRMGKWVTFRQHIALRCKHQFQHHLWTRGYYGKVIFDHNAGTLNLKVQTDDQASTQSKDKDPKSLSGGEKSYSTICLLLALWESIQCPLRCLDEFDVFMDSVNRRISMKMMIDTANTSDKQYILITPQDMSHVALGPTVRVHRMNDPERNQAPLAF